MERNVGLWVLRAVVLGLGLGCSCVFPFSQPYDSVVRLPRLEERNCTLGARFESGLSKNSHRTDWTFFGGCKIPETGNAGTFFVSGHLPVTSYKGQSRLSDFVFLVDWYKVLDLWQDEHEKKDGGVKRGVKRYVWNQKYMSEQNSRDSGRNKKRDKKYTLGQKYIQDLVVLAKLGVSFPTANARKMLDGSNIWLDRWGVPIGVGLEGDFKYSIKAGIDFDMLVFHDSDRLQRTKDKDGVEHVLYAKANVGLGYGVEWQLHAYVQAFRFRYGFSAKAAYQFVQGVDDWIIEERDKSNTSETINASRIFSDWHAHKLIFSLNYDGGGDTEGDEKEDWSFAPQVHLFWKIPIAGKSVIRTHTIGGQLAFNF